jgi:hypothetical protein
MNTADKLLKGLAVLLPLEKGYTQQIQIISGGSLFGGMQPSDLRWAKN